MSTIHSIAASRFDGQWVADWSLNHAARQDTQASLSRLLSSILYIPTLDSTAPVAH
jgi:hypothetical protein